MRRTVAVLLVAGALAAASPVGQAPWPARDALVPQTNLYSQQAGGGVGRGPGALPHNPCGLQPCVMLAALDAQAKPVPRPAPLGELSHALEALSRRVGPAVVQIFSNGYSLGEEGGSGNTGVITRQSSTGSGVLLSADGFIVTNRHVVAGARRVRVRLAAPSKTSSGGTTMHPAGNLLDARIVGVDRYTDLAVLKIETKAAPHLVLGDSDRLRQGQIVMAFGNPLGLENSVSMGVVSSVARQIRPDDPMTYIQTDAPINPGNSGGPLVDPKGQVMGINTFIFSQSGGSEGLGFAIPSNVVKNVYAQICKEGHVHRGEIGIYGQSITAAIATGLHLDRDWGVVLADVEPGSPAEKAGLQVGDIVLNLNGKPMDNARTLQVELFRHHVGDKVKLDVLREKLRLTFTVPVAVRENDEGRFADLADPARNLIPELGVLGIAIDESVADMLPDLRKSYGVVVAARTGDSPLNGPQLEVGDVIHAVNTEPVTSVKSLRDAVQSLIKATGSVILQVERDGHLRYFSFEIE